METHTFTHNDQNYEIRIVSDGHSVFVRAFLEGKPANGIRHEATLDTVSDAANVADLDVVKELVKTAEADIRRQ
jgi:hypothetical protein